MKTTKTPRRLRIFIAGIVFVLILLAFSGFCPRLTPLLKIQAGPLQMWHLAMGVGAALVGLIVIAVLTGIFGRFYCSLICPMGIAQDIVAFLSCRKSQPLPKHLGFLRAFVLLFTLAILACTCTFGYMLFDPYSNFGRAFAPASIVAVLPVIVILGLAVWRPRLFCNAVCPVGTLLGFCASVSGGFRLRISDKCVKCKKCVKSCNAGCIDIDNHNLDNARCVRCMNCLATCPTGAIQFSLKKLLNSPPAENAATATEEQPASNSRREFLVTSAGAVVGLGTAIVLAKTGVKHIMEKIQSTLKILPPGAGSAERFASKCTACQLCTRNCPAHIIKPNPLGYGPVSLDLSRGSCIYTCNTCSQVCPTGAIRPLKQEAKQRLRIAQAAIDFKKCKVFIDVEDQCGKCSQVCPTHAITLRKTGAPKLNKDLCIGCGACQHICPNHACSVNAIEKQEPVATKEA